MTPADPDPFDLSAYRAWRAEHPTRPLPRDVEEALVAEVERQLARISDLVHGYTFAREKATAQERAAAVAWLREIAPSAPTRRGADELTWCADRIERGDHRRKEGGP